MILFAPLLAVAASTIAPTAASAITSYGTCNAGAASANCPGGLKFTEFPANEHVNMLGEKVSTKVILENVANKTDITCSGLESTGFLVNRTGVGNGTLLVNLTGCTSIGSVGGKCEANSELNLTTNHEIEGVIHTKVVAEEKVELKIASGFNVKCVKGGFEVEVGNITGTVNGTQTSKTSVLSLAKTAGLTVGGEAMTLSAEVEFLDVTTKVYI
jgi:hypothetical protein